MFDQDPRLKDGKRTDVSEFDCRTAISQCEKIDKCRKIFKLILAKCLSNSSKHTKMSNSNITNVNPSNDFSKSSSQHQNSKPIRLIKTNLGNNGVRAGNFFEFIYGKKR